MRILITGARGFIGAATASAADARGHQVVAVDQSELGRSLPHRATVVLGDITRPDEWRAALAGVDVVVHAAAVHHTDRIAAAPVRSIEVNLRGTRELLEAAASSGVRTFVHLSSAKVYGEPLRFPSTEDDLLNPVEPYGLAKAVSEDYCRYFDARRSMRCVAVRPFSVYGPGQDLTTGYVGQLIRARRDRRPVVLSGEPGYVRDFVHVDDVVDVCLAAATAPEPPLVVNSGSGRATTLAELVGLFSEMDGGLPEVGYAPARAGTIERTLADTTLQATLLRREPTDLRRGLRQTVESFEPEVAEGA